jgi:hypothetical protein
MRKGIILEINDLYLTLLTPEGEFLRARKLQQVYQVGEEIHFFPEMAVTKRKKFNLSIFNSVKTKTMAIAAAMMLVMAAFIPAYQSGQVYAYMSIDVNPSVELAVSDELKVIRLKGYNPEGKEIVENLVGWKKKDAAVVAEMILDKIEAKGYFKEKHDVVIATVHNGKVKEAVDRKLKQKITAIKQATQEEELELKVMEGTSEDREKAQKQGISTGVYKEKQVEKGKPVNKPVKQEDKPDEAKKNTITPVNPKPDKKEPPGQVKKENPVQPKAEPAKPAEPTSEKSNGRPSHHGQNKKTNQNNSHGNSGHAVKNSKRPNSDNHVKYNQNESYSMKRNESNKQDKRQSSHKRGNKGKN